MPRQRVRPGREGRHISTALSDYEAQANLVLVRQHQMKLSQARASKGISDRISEDRFKISQAKYSRISLGIDPALPEHCLGMARFYGDIVPEITLERVLRDYDYPTVPQLIDFMMKNKALTYWGYIMEHLRWAHEHPQWGKSADPKKTREFIHRTRADECLARGTDDYNKALSYADWVSAFRNDSQRLVGRVERTSEELEVSQIIAS